MKKIFIVCIILVTLASVCLIPIIVNKNKEEVFEWQAKYIWVSTEIETEEERKNTWVCFRKKIDIENKRDIEDIIAKISVDSKYWLYINDELVLREGRFKTWTKRNINLL